MKLVALLSLGALAIASATNVALIPTVQAESRTPAEATAHALDELANCHAQQRPECPTETPTLTSTPTWTPSPTATSTAQPTDTPTAVPIATPAPEPCWLTDDNGIVFDLDGAPVPCPLEDAQEATVDAAEPTLVPTPTNRPTQAPRQAGPRPAAAAAPVPAPAVAAPPEPAAPLPTYTPYPTYTPQPTWTPGSARTIVSTPTAAITATRTPVPTGTALVASTGTPVPIAASERAGTAPLNVPWGMLAAVFAGTAAVFGACWLGIAIKRRTVVRKPRPPREDVYA